MKNTTKRLLIIMIITVVNVIAIAGLLILSEFENHRKNGFIRLFPPHLIVEDTVIDIDYNSYYIAGMSSDFTYMGNLVSPGVVSIVNHRSYKRSSLTLEIPAESFLAWKRVKLAVDSPAVYLYDGTTASLLSGKLSNTNMQLQTLDTFQFSQAIILSSRSAIVRNYHELLQQNVLRKKNISGQQSEIFIPQKQLDGIFCTDGNLLFEPRIGRVYYIFHYRNQFICLDSNLNVKYVANTIDTNSTAKIKLAYLNNGSDRTLTSPAINVNRKASVCGERLYVNSGLRANNENKATFDDASVIDVYNTVTGRYELSFYLPRNKDKQIDDFKVYDKTLVATYDHYLAFYKLNF